MNRQCPFNSSNPFHPARHLLKLKIVRRLITMLWVARTGRRKIEIKNLKKVKYKLQTDIFQKRNFFGGTRP